MAVGKGIYDDALTMALESVGASQGIVMVFDGENGLGFSCHATESNTKTIPNLLRVLADEIEKGSK